MSGHEGQTPSRSGSGYAVIDLTTRPIFGFGIALTAIVLITAGILQWQFQFLTERANAEQVQLHPLAATSEEPPEPRLLADPTAHFHEYALEQRARLERPAWIDQPNGVVRVPIGRAMELVLDEGLPNPVGPDPDPVPAPENGGAPR